MRVKVTMNAAGGGEGKLLKRQQQDSQREKVARDVQGNKCVYIEERGRLTKTKTKQIKKETNLVRKETHPVRKREEETDDKIPKKKTNSLTRRRRNIESNTRIFFPLLLCLRRVHQRTFFFTLT